MKSDALKKLIKEAVKEAIAEELKDIIKEFTEIVSNARRTSDSPDAIQYLLHKLSSD